MGNEGREKNTVVENTFFCYNIVLWSIGNYYGMEEWVWKTAAEKRLADKGAVKQVTGGLARLLTKGIPKPARRRRAGAKLWTGAYRPLAGSEPAVSAHRVLAFVDHYGVLSVLAQILFGLLA